MKTKTKVMGVGKSEIVNKYMLTLCGCLSLPMPAYSRRRGVGRSVPSVCLSVCRRSKRKTA